MIENMARSRPVAETLPLGLSGLNFLQHFFLVAAFFVSPLIFFTNLTRNPYITQICALNISISIALTLWMFQNYGELRKLKTVLNLPMLFWTLIIFISWGYAFFRHVKFFRPSVFNEGLNHEIFWVINCVGAFFIGVASIRNQEEAGEDVNIWAWAGFSVTWGSLWFLFPLMRSPNSPATDIAALVWNGYGAFLWALGVGCCVYLSFKRRAIDYLHLALTVGFLASVYGVLQYFNFEFIWPHALNPYGGRAVSTFGNPNFLSSYNVVLLPFCVVLWARSKGGARYWYGICALTLEAGLLCSLTRSSWLGAFVAVSFLFFSKGFIRLLRKEIRLFGLFFGVGFAVFILWPHSLLSAGYHPSVLGRLEEVDTLLKPGPTKQAYSPWHQRVMIWTCAWLMAKDNPLTGQGFGLFELFYPFYQGPVLRATPFYWNLRTHANNAHNEALEVLSQTGLLGLGLFIWVWVVFFRFARDFTNQEEDSLQNLWVSAGAAGVLGMLADNLLNVSLHFAVPAFLFWWVVGSCVGNGRVNFSKANEGKNKKNIWVFISVLGLCVWMIGRWSCVWEREVHYFSGFKLARQGDMAGAINQLEISKHWGPPEVNAIYELGNAYARSGFFRRAEKNYQAALDSNAGYDEIFFNKGAIEANHLNDIVDAINNFRVSWLINPLLKDVYNSLGALYLRDPLKYLSPALDLLSYGVKVFPQDSGFWNNLGYLETLNKNYPEAVSDYQRALQINPNLTAARKNLEVLTHFRP